ncbi:glycosyltransferase family 39 protein [Streptacidiphilus monticola]
MVRPGRGEGYHPALVPLPGNGVFTMEQNSVAFFPLYPALMRIVSSVTGLGSYGAGMLVSVLASLVAAAGIYALTDRLYGRRAGILAAGLWAVFPGAGVAWSLYSESLFTAFAAWACWAVVTRRWTAAGLLTLFAGLTRPSASVLVVAVCAAALVALYRRDDGLRPLSGLLLAPVGFVGYLAWASWKLGSVTGYFTLQERAWAHKVDWGYNLFRAVRGLGLGRYDYLFPYPIEDLIALAVTLALPFLLLAYFRLRPPWCSPSTHC